MEIVAPAGDYNRFLACIKGGADSIYLGLIGVGARRKAPNFTLDELKDAVDYAHLRGVKIYLTLNTVFRDSEIEALYENVKTLYEYGVDAFIVQDIGMIKFLRENFAGIELHGSTQMTVSNHVEANYMKSLGLSRVVLSRELSFEDISSIKNKSDIELEVFVSGALCVSYSGNCYLSSFIGSRSGNRGMCAQPCRKEYDNALETSYFLSPKDQIMSEKEIDLLKSIGIESIKVEGRMKSEEYVYETVSYYRGILNNFYRENQSYKFFNRGYSTGYFYGNNIELMNKNFSFDLGYLLGILKGKEFTLSDNLILGDGVVYLDKDYNKLGGEYINKIFDINEEPLIKASKGDVIILKKLPEDTVYVHKSYDKVIYDSVMKELKEGKRRAPIDIFLDIKTNEKVVIRFKFKDLEAKLEGNVLELAKNPLDIEKIKEKVQELGETTFFAKEINVDYDNKAFLPFAYLKELKRECAKLLETKLVESYRRVAGKKVILEKTYKTSRKKPEIFVSVLDENQMEIVKEYGIKNVYYKNPDVIKESNLDKVDIQNNLVGNLCQLLSSEADNLWLDWNSNTINSYACKELENMGKLEGIFISPEIKKEDIKKIDTYSLKKGIVVYGKMRVMYIEKALTEEKTVLMNEQEDKLILRKNSFGNTEVYLNAELNLIPELDEIEDLGIDAIKLEFTFENKEEIIEILNSVSKRSGKYKPYNYENGLY